MRNVRGADMAEDPSKPSVDYATPGPPGAEPEAEATPRSWKRVPLLLLAWTLALVSWMLWMVMIVYLFVKVFGAG